MVTPGQRCRERICPCGGPRLPEDWGFVFLVCLWMCAEPVRLLPPVFRLRDLAIAFAVHRRHCFPGVVH